METGAMDDDSRRAGEANCSRASDRSHLRFDAHRRALERAEAVAQASAAVQTPCTMKKKAPAKKKSAPKKTPRKDAAQVALSIVEQVTGGKLKR